MKTMNKITTVFAIAGLTLMSCGNDKKNASYTEDRDNTDTEIKTETPSIDNEEHTDENVIMTREYAMNDGREITYDFNSKGLQSLNNWSDFNTLSYEMAEIEAVDFSSTNDRILNWDGVISNLGNTIPEWLKTEEVMEDIDDIQKEYKELIAEKNASQKEQKENLEELSEQFADLREELNETIDRYMNVNEEAIEEFNEEMKKGKVEAAKEEYQEEIKKLDDIADQKDK